MKLTLLICSLVFPTALLAHDLGDCGHYFEPLKIKTFTIDDGTKYDLRLESLVAPLIARHVTTGVGRTRLNWLLVNSGTKTAEIMRRQRAVRFLVEQPAARASAKKMLKAIKDAEHGEGVTANLDDLVRHDTGWKKARDTLRSLTAFGVLGTVAGITATGVTDWRGGVIALVMLGASGQANAKWEDYFRERIHSFEPMVELLSLTSSELEQIEGTTLADLGSVFRLLLDPSVPESLMPLRQAYRRTWGENIRSLAIASSTSNFFTARLRRNVTRRRRSLEVMSSAIGDLDVLVALAELALTPGYTFPTLLDETGPTHLSIVRGQHPWLFDKKAGRSVSNGVEFSVQRAAGAANFALLTGPHQGGKSTYLRMIGSLVLLAQMGGAVPAEAMRLTPLAVLSTMNVRDELEDNESFFYVQGLRLKQILDRTEGPAHVLVLMDELLTGTSPEEHRAIEQSLIKYFARSASVSTLATQDRKLHTLADEVSSAINLHVVDQGPDKYTVKPGPSTQLNAIQVLREIGIPTEITDEAQRYLNEHG